MNIKYFFLWYVGPKPEKDRRGKEKGGNKNRIEPKNSQYL